MNFVGFVCSNVTAVYIYIYIHIHLTVLHTEMHKFYLVYVNIYIYIE